ncbi:mesothelin-like protein [Lycodopsis pacificus]
MVKTWNKQTLLNLGDLPLYFTGDIWGQIRSRTKRRFLRTFLRQLRQKKTKKSKLKKLVREARTRRIKRGAGCTVGNITQVTVSDNAFPFDYDQTQFDLCLDIPVLRDNLNSICEKVDEDDFQKIILTKLNQAFPSGVSDDKVQVLGSVSRVASLADISKWNITKVDTLAALMKADDGSWEAAKSKAIITKYLATSGNSLGSTELNSIGSNVCSLDTSTLRTITPDSIRNAKPLNVASCSSEQKRVLYEISNMSFSSPSSSSNTYYNLIRPYLGGARLSDIVALSTTNISMDVNTFESLDPNVTAGLTVANVKLLVGMHVQDLKLFENATQVENWRNMQTQADLDILGVGLTTDRATVMTTQGSSSSAGANPTTVTTAQVVQVTTSDGAQLARYPMSIFVAALLTTVLQMLQPV